MRSLNCKQIEVDEIWGWRAGGIYHNLGAAARDRMPKARLRWCGLSNQESEEKVKEIVKAKLIGGSSDGLIMDIPGICAVINVYKMVSNYTEKGCEVKESGIETYKLKSEEPLEYEFIKFTPKP